MNQDAKPVKARSEMRMLLLRVGSLAGSRASGSLLTLLYTLLIARLVTPDQFGLAMLGLSWALLISVPLSMNIEGGAIRFLVKYIEEGQIARAAGYVRANLLMLAGMSAVVGAVTLAVYLSGLINIAEVAGRVMLLSVLIAPLLAFTRVLGRHATALDAVLRGSLPRMLVRPLLFCAVLSAVWLTGASIDADHIMMVFGAAALITAILQIVLLRHVSAPIRKATPDLSGLKEWIQTGISLLPLLLLRDYLKNFILAAAGLVLSAADVGRLALALSVLAIVFFSVKAVDIAVSPRLSQAIHRDDAMKAGRFLGLAASTKLAGLAIALLVFWTLGETLFGLFGPGYAESAGVMLLLFGLPIVSAVFGSSDTVLTISGHRRAILTVCSITICVLGLSTIAGGSIAGLEGAAVGAVLAYGVHFALLRRTCMRLTQIDPSARSIKNLLI